MRHIITALMKCQVHNILVNGFEMKFFIIYLFIVYRKLPRIPLRGLQGSR